jgi:hypothetical protein
MPGGTAASVGRGLHEATAGEAVARCVESGHTRLVVNRADGSDLGGRGAASEPMFETTIGQRPTSGRA